MFGWFKKKSENGEEKEQKVRYRVLHPVTNKYKIGHVVVVNGIEYFRFAPRSKFYDIPVKSAHYSVADSF